jgi:hypothetical protein
MPRAGLGKTVQTFFGPSGRVVEPRRASILMIRIELSPPPPPTKGQTIATACGISVRSRAPVLSLCRRLIQAGHDPAEPAEAWRGETLCLHIRSIGEAAELSVSKPAGGG